MNINDLLVQLDQRDTLLANDAASTIRELLREVEKNTTPAVPPDLIRCNSTRLNTVGEVMALCERWRVAGGREEHHAYKEEIERVVEKLVSDRDVLLSALEHAEPWLDGLTAGDVARAAIQKVTNHD